MMQATVSSAKRVKGQVGDLGSIAYSPLTLSNPTERVASL